MAQSRSSGSLQALALGGLVGIAFVLRDDWFTQFVAGVIGAATAWLAYQVIRLCRRGDWPCHIARSEMKDCPGRDADLSAYRVERVFMDDGKPW